MSTAKVLLSLITSENDYQRAQAAAAEAVARRMGAQLQIVYADNDPVLQSQQILSAVQKKDHGLDAVITEPAGTGMLQVASAAVKAGISWGVLNREIDYVAALRTPNVQVFEVGVDQEEVGRIHASQVAALLPGGGTLLYIEGPAAGSTAKLRTQGFTASKPDNIQVKALKGNWTEESAHKAISSWLRLSTSRSHGFVGVIGHNDDMTVGAHKAFAELTDANERSNWLQMPFIGCDGLPDTGQQHVRRGILAATVIHPLVAAIGLEMFLKAKSLGSTIPDRTLAKPSSFPALEALRPRAALHGV